jgi:predicted nucleotidyltransferase
MKTETRSTYYDHEVADESVRNSHNQSLTIRSVLQKFKEYLEKLYGSNLKKIILFGSQARGEANPNSDVDILIVTEKKLSKQKRHQLICLISDISIEEDILINFIEMLTPKFQSEQSPLLLNIRREGIIL